MKKIAGVRITNATSTGQTLITLILVDAMGNKTKKDMTAVIATDAFTGETIYHAETKELDEAMHEFMETATKSEKYDGEKFAYIYK